MRRARIAAALLATCALAACDLAVGVDWAAYEAFDAPPASPCDGSCATAAITFEGDGDLDLRGFAATSDGGFLLWGTAAGPSTKLGIVAPSEFVVKTCSAGQVRWTITYPAAVGTRLHAVVSDDQGGAWIAGAGSGEPGATEFLEHIVSDGSSAQRSTLPAPVLALAHSPVPTSAPLAAVLATAPTETPFPEGACEDGDAIDATGVHVVRLDPSGACVDRQLCSQVASAPEDTPAALLFDPTGRLLFVAPFDAPGPGLITCGKIEPADAGTRGMVVARASGSSAFDVDFGPDRLLGYAPAGPLFLAVDPSLGQIWIAGTTSEPITEPVSVSAPTTSMFLVLLVDTGNPDEVVQVGSGTMGTSRAGSLAFGPDGHLSFAASVRGRVNWQNGIALEGQDNDDRIVITDVAPGAQGPTYVLGLDPLGSGAPLPLVASAPGCAPTLAASFSGAIGASGGNLIAKGADIALVPFTTAGLFPAPPAP